MKQYGPMSLEDSQENAKLLRKKKIMILHLSIVEMFYSIVAQLTLLLVSLRTIE